MNTTYRMLPQGSEWDFASLELYEKEIANIAKRFNLDTYSNQIEVISPEQIIHLYASTGLPVNYPHWSFGKQFVNTEKLYRHGLEMVSIAKLG